MIQCPLCQHRMEAAIDANGDPIDLDHVETVVCVHCTEVLKRHAPATYRPYTNEDWAMLDKKDEEALIEYRQTVREFNSRKAAAAGHLKDGTCCPDGCPEQE